MSAALGGIVGLYIAPAVFPLGLVDVLVISILPAVMVTLALNADRWSRSVVVVYALLAASSFLFPFYIPGPAAGFRQPAEPLHFLLSAVYWFVPLVMVIAPQGRAALARWVRSDYRGLRCTGIFLSTLIGLFMWWICWTRPYWFLFRYPAALGIATFIRYAWWVPALAVLTTAMAVPILEVLPRRDLPRSSRIPG